MSKVRIAFFLDVMEEDFDGVSVTMHQIIRRIPQMFDPIFITPHPPISDVGYPVYICPSIAFPFGNKSYKLALPGRMKNLERILDDFAPELIHFSSPSTMGSYALKYAKKRDLPVTTIYHTHFPSFAVYYFRYLPGVEFITEMAAYPLFKFYRKVTRVFAPTESMKNYLLGKDVREDQIKVWGRGVNTEKFGPSNRVTDLWPEIPEGNKKVLFVSRLVKEKEPKTLIRLYNLFAKRRPDITMVVVGEGPTKSQLEANMPSAVFTGKLTGNDLAKAYASSDVFVFPSTTETFGNVVLEALASGLPVVAANAGGPKDIINPGVTGMLVEPRQEQLFYEEIVKLVDDEAYYGKVQGEAIAYARSQNWDSLCAELFGEYLSIIDQ